MDDRPNVEVDHTEINIDLPHEHLDTLPSGAAENTARSREPDFGQDLLHESFDDGVEGFPGHLPSMSDDPEPASKETAVAGSTSNDDLSPPADSPLSCRPVPPEI